MEIDFTDAEDSNLKESKTTTCRPFTMNILTENINPPEDILQEKTSAEQDILRKNWVSINIITADVSQSTFRIISYAISIISQIAASRQ